MFFKVRKPRLFYVFNAFYAFAGTGVYDGRRGRSEADDAMSDTRGKCRIPSRDDAGKQRVRDHRGGADVVRGQSGERAGTPYRRS